MNRMQQVNRLAESVAALPSPSCAATKQSMPELEAAALGRELAKIAQAEIAALRSKDPREKPADDQVGWILAKTPSEVTFGDLEKLVRIDPAQMQVLWEKVKAAAHDDLATGRRSGEAVDIHCHGAWERACFLAIRTALQESWPPRSPGESLLLNELTQYEILRHRWLRILANHTAEVQSLQRQKAIDETRNGEPVISQAAATREAILMLDRLQRLAQRTLRLFLSLRRGPSALIVRQARQINVSTGQQLNVSAIPETEEATVTPSECSHSRSETT